MAYQRAETVFEIDGEEYRRRPTFGSIASIESAHGAIAQLLQRIAGGEVGVAETAKIVHTILGGRDRGGPKLNVVQDAVFDDYGDNLKRVAEFLTNAITDDSEAADTGNARRKTKTATTSEAAE